MLAKELGWAFIDTDQEIESQAGMTIAEMFQQHGEAYFRQREREMIIEQCTQQERVVLSLGGGAFIQDEVREACLRSGRTIFLEVSWDVWVERMKDIMAGRPILQTRSLEEIEQLYNMRKTFYEQCDTIMVTDGQSAEQVTERIIQKLMLNQAH